MTHSIESTPAHEGPQSATEGSTLLSNETANPNPAQRLIYQHLSHGPRHSDQELPNDKS